jgi:hypothetical protein
VGRKKMLEAFSSSDPCKEDVMVDEEVASPF